MRARKILVVEDEKNLGMTLREYLESQGHVCTLATSVLEGREIFNSFSPDLTIMDIGLPDGSGLSLGREFKQKNNAPLLFLSALNAPETRLEGLELGASDYITKPFALKELILRLNKIFDSTPLVDDVVSHGKLKIKFNSFELEDAEGNSIPLGQKECAILSMLYHNRGSAIGREEIIEKIWGEDKCPSSRTVDNYIVKLRKWCESDPSEPIQIKSIRGIGYKLVIT